MSVPPSPILRMPEQKAVLSMVSPEGFLECVIKNGPLKLQLPIPNEGNAIFVTAERGPRRVPQYHVHTDAEKLAHGIFAWGKTKTRLLQSISYTRDSITELVFQGGGDMFSTKVYTHGKPEDHFTLVEPRVLKVTDQDILNYIGLGGVFHPYDQFI